MAQRRPTLEDVARTAGVSRSTVSRVVNGGRAVAPAVRQRVHGAIAQLDYRPDAAARALASGRAEVVDLVVIDDDATTFGVNPYYTRVVAGVFEALVGTDARLRVHVVDEPEAGRVLENVARDAGLGALLVNVPAPLGADFHHRCDRVVSLGGSAPGVASIDPDNSAGAYAGVRHLLDAGRRRVAAVHGPSANSCAAGRRHGYFAALRDAGMSPLSVQGDFRRETGLDGVRRLLAADPDVDAVFAACDLTATGVLQGLAESGRRVPDDVAVVGFDDCLLATCTSPPLTSVFQPVEEIARTATAALLRREVSGRTWVLPTALRVRASSAG